jgi:hypothetical protein
MATADLQVFGRDSSELPRMRRRCHSTPRFEPIANSSVSLGSCSVLFCDTHATALSELTGTTSSVRAAFMPAHTAARGRARHASGGPAARPTFARSLAALPDPSRVTTSRHLQRR